MSSVDSMEMKAISSSEIFRRRTPTNVKPASVSEIMHTNFDDCNKKKANVRNSRIILTKQPLKPFECSSDPLTEARKNKLRMMQQSFETIDDSANRKADAQGGKEYQRNKNRAQGHRKLNNTQIIRGCY